MEQLTQVEGKTENGEFTITRKLNTETNKDKNKTIDLHNKTT